MMTDSNLTAGEVALWEAMQGAPLPGPQTKEQLLDRISKKPPAYVLAYIASVVERGCFKAAVEHLRHQPPAITPDATTAPAAEARDAVLEEAAKVAEGLFESYTPNGWGHAALEQVAHRIRSLKSKEG